jgi:hypothetical protein
MLAPSPHSAFVPTSRWIPFHVALRRPPSPNRRISLRTFKHVMDLDLTFHLRKKTGEVTRVVDRGTNAMQNLLSTVLFNILPQVGNGWAGGGGMHWGCCGGCVRVGA